MSNKQNPALSLPSPAPYMLRAMIAWIVENNLTPHILFDATQENVVVPAVAVQENGSCILNVSGRASNNLSIDEEYTSFQARFSGKSEQIFIPHGALIAIFAKETGQGMALQGIHHYHERSAEMVQAKPELRSVESAPLLQMGVSDMAVTEAAKDIPATTSLGPDVPVERTPRTRGHLTLVSSK